VNGPMKAAIVTGALPGIGRAVALRLASNTAKAVHGGAVMKMLPLSTSNNQGFDATFATNVRGTFNVLKQAARRVSDGSRIVTLSTSVIALSLPGYGPLRQEQIDRFTHLPPLERLVTPEDIANVVSFLAGPDGGWVNRQVLRANGGYA